MKVKPADLTALPERAEGEIYWVVSNGIKASGMPAFKDKMGEAERWQTVLHVRHLMGEHVHGERGAEAAAGGERQQQTPHRGETRKDSAAQHEGHPQKAQPSAQKEAGKEPQAGHEGHSPAGRAAPASDGAHADHEMADHGMMDMMATVTGGPFRTMQAVGSGTALQPASTPIYAWQWMLDEWMVMLHSEIKVGFNYQGGRRGVGKAESQNWLMLMAERRVGRGNLMLRGMFSAEGLTAPHGGFPQLFQTGEIYRRRPIIDAQHPHDLFMELSAGYTIPISEAVSFQLYGGPVGEPALGPVAFPHRLSAMENPAAPLGHHLQDSTHITGGVITGALTAGLFKFEGSLFHGAEPDENRATIDLGKLDSYSFRAWFTPTANWAAQFSYGRLRDPEELEPGVIKRMTASLAYNRPLGRGNWASTLIWGRNDEEHGGNENSYLFESTVNFLNRNYLYTRMELLDREGLLGDNIFGRPGLVRVPVIPPGRRDNHEEVDLPAELERSFRIAAFTFGGVRDLIANEMFRLGTGADFTIYHKPSELDPIYGRRPASFRIFLRFRPSGVR